MPRVPGAVSPCHEAGQLLVPSVKHSVQTLCSGFPEQTAPRTAARFDALGYSQARICTMAWVRFHSFASPPAETASNT